MGRYDSAMRISDVAREERPLAIDFGGGATLNIVYRNSKMSFNDMARLVTRAALAAKAKDAGDVQDIAARVEASADSVITPLVEALVSWDLTEDDGETLIPITEAGLRSVPSSILVEITKAMQEDQRAAGGKAR